MCHTYEVIIAIKSVKIVSSFANIIDFLMANMKEFTLAPQYSDDPNIVW